MVLSNINISLKLHDPDLIVLVNHEDCGAYGGSKKFASKEEEEQFHEQELDKAQETLSKIIGSDKKIEKIFLKIWILSVIISNPFVLLPLIYPK